MQSIFKPFFASLALILSAGGQAQSEITLKVTSRYLNFPVSHAVDRKGLTFVQPGQEDQRVEVRLTPGKPDYWVFRDVGSWRGKKVTLRYEGAEDCLRAIVQADTIMGESQMYREPHRPQFHFTTRRGWINDPNGLVYHEGLYHLYYQHNPYEREWGNMTWGHATSPDLIHWTEQPCVLFPDRLGTMFSGSAVWDQENTSGLGSKQHPPLVYAYTADRAERQTQCIAWSTDGGYTLHKDEGNPVVDSHDKWKSHDTRDPRLLWYAPSAHWVMVLNERDGHSIYTSSDLLKWTFESHVPGFWECPDLFELPVDGDASHKKWVMLGASGTYVVGSFDGKTFTPETPKQRNVQGLIYAAQTVSHAPEGRCIQIGWGRVSHPGMPFNGQMQIPTELSLRTTPWGIRLYSVPVKEFSALLTPWIRSSQTLDIHSVNSLCEPLDSRDGLHLKTSLQLTYSTSAGITIDGQTILDYDTNQNTINGQFYAAPDPTSLRLEADIYVDRTSVEVFIDGGLYSYSLERRPGEKKGVEFWGNETQVLSLEADRIASIWH